MHQPPRFQEPFESWEVEAVRREVIFVSGARFLSPQDLEDLQQECLVHWLTVRHRYDPSRGATRAAFIKTVVRNRALDLLEAWRRRRDLSIEQALSPGSGMSIGDLIPDPSASPEELALTADLIECLAARLDGRRRRLLSLLLKGLSIAESAAALSVSRDTANEDRRHIGRRLYEVQNFEPIRQIEHANRLGESGGREDA